MTGIKNFGAGVTFIAGFVLICLLTVALYQGRFNSTIPITVNSDRAGLTMAPNAVVKVRGIEVGKVTAVHPAPGGARISIKVDTSEVKWIGKNATARIVPPTAFGAKYVEITSDRPTNDQRIQARDAISVKGVTVEINSAFSHLAEVLAAAHPDKVNNAVTALSTALDGQGATLGQLVTRVDSYLTTFNRSLPDLERGLNDSTKVAKTYADLSPNLIALLDNTTTTSTTLTERQSQIDTLSRRLDAFSKNGQSFVDENATPLERLLKILQPTTTMLKRYSPVLPCFLRGVTNADLLAQAAVGGIHPGISTYTKLQPTDPPYARTQQLPKVAADRGPDCFGLPIISAADAAKPNPDFGTGLRPASGPTSPTGLPLADTLFGTLAGLVTAK